MYIFRNFRAGLILPFLLLFLAFPVYADYASLQSADCTLLIEYTGPAGLETLINSSTNCSPYTLVGSTTPASIQVFGKCTNGDILNPRFDVFTYDGTRGNEIGHSKLYQVGANFPLFLCDGVDRNVDGVIKMPLGSNLSFFVAVSDASSSAPVVDLFEKGIGGFARALIHFDIGKGGAPQEPPKPDPVIIIPGILGSSDKNGAWVIDPIFHTYDDLIATLKANGFVDDKDIFTFPYDWRQSNVITAVQLRNKINEVQAICGCAKVDLVAHSMGGLVARQYIQSTQYENDVDQLIFLGTPHLGAPFAYLMWEAGEIGTKTGNTGERLRDWFMKFVLSREAKKSDFASLFDYVRNKPISSVQELLPIYDYLRDKSSGNLRVYPNNYPQNAFLENLKTSALSLFDKNIKITNITGDLGNSSTLNAIRVIGSPSLPLWENGYPDGFDGSIVDKGFEFGFGDGTVPKDSSEFIVSDLNQLSAEHNELARKAEGLVFKKLTGKDPLTLIDTGLSISPKLLIIKILSPIDVLVTAPDGKRVGKDFGTDSEVNEIDGAFYSGFLTDNEYLTIPNPLDGEYKIETQGTGSGSYTVAVGYITDENLVEQEFTGETATSILSDLTLSFTSTTPNALKFSITLQDIVTDIEMSYNLGWITKNSTKENLMRKLERIIKHEREVNMKNLKTFIDQLEREHPKNINDQAYNLLKEDINWLLNNL
ncbi:MAG: hypothetical protein Q8Q89_05325 [bacterium]|nr:hypothetical protein [bacterium]